MSNDVVVVIFAAGAGTRFWPIQKNKSLFPFLGLSLLEYNLRLLAAAGFNQAIIVTCPADQEAVKKIQVAGISLVSVVQSLPHGMGDAMLQAQRAIDSRPCLVINGADLVEESLYRTLAAEVAEKKIFIVGKKVNEYFDCGYLKFVDSKLVGIIEKPGKGQKPSDLVNLVFHYFPQPNIFFTALAGSYSKKDDVYEQALTQVIGKNQIKVIGYDGYWQSLKYPWHVLDLMDHLLGTLRSHRGKQVEIKDNVILEGEVYLSDGVRIFENTKIVGPCYIGPHTVIGNNNIIRSSHLGSNCVTGFNTDITRSYIGADCWFHSNYIGDSVLEENISLGSGTVLANLRLDEGEISSVVKKEKRRTGRKKLGAIIGRNVRAGVNTSFMPGVKVGADSLVGAGIVLDKDLPEKSFCVAQKGYTVSPNKSGVHVRLDEFRRHVVKPYV